MSELFFDLDTSELETVARGLGASEHIVKSSFSAALNFTARKLRTLSVRALQEGLDMKSQKYIRSRLKHIRLKQSGMDEIKLWYGLNDLNALAWGTPKQTASGVQVGSKSVKGAFRAKVPSFGGGKSKTGAFVRKPGGKRRSEAKVSRKTGRKYTSQLPVQLATVGINDQAQIIIEDDVLVDFEVIFFTEYERQLKWRMEKQSKKA